MLVWSYLSGVILLLLLPTAFLIARYLAKRARRLPWTVDDTLLVLSLVMLYAVAALLLAAMLAGRIRQHISTATLRDLELTLMILWLFRLPMASSMALTRCAISIFFVRTFYTHMFPWLRRIAYGCIIAAIALGLTSVIGILMHCMPVKYNWRVPFENPKYCYELRPFVICMAVVGLFVDLLTWSLPHCVVWRLQLRLTHKLAITTIFAFGLLNIVIGGLRIGSLADVAYQGDVTFGIGATLMWSIAQMSTGLIVACAPHLRPVLERMVPARLTRIRNRKPQSDLSSIRVTTRIDVYGNTRTPTLTTPFHDGQQELWAPTFVVEKGLASVPESVCPRGPSRPPRCLC